MRVRRDRRGSAPFQQSRASLHETETPSGVALESAQCDVECVEGRACSTCAQCRERHEQRMPACALLRKCNLGCWEGRVLDAG